MKSIRLVKRYIIQRYENLTYKKGLLDFTFRSFEL